MSQINYFILKRRQMIFKKNKMKLRGLSILTFLISSLFACNQNSKQPENIKAIDTAKPSNTLSSISTPKIDSSINSKNIEDKIIDTIFNLPEIKELANYIENQTKGKRHLKVWVSDTPNLSDHKYYWIKVGEDNGTNLVTHLNFYVYPDSMRIMYYDTQSDNILTLGKWRKKNGM